MTVPADACCAFCGSRGSGLAEALLSRATPGPPYFVCTDKLACAGRRDLLARTARA